MRTLDGGLEPLEPVLCASAYRPRRGERRAAWVKQTRPSGRRPRTDVRLFSARLCHTYHHGHFDGRRCEHSVVSSPPPGRARRHA